MHAVKDEGGLEDDHDAEAAAGVDRDAAARATIPTFKAVIDDIWNLMSKVDWPEENDYKGTKIQKEWFVFDARDAGSIHGILRVQFTYRLPILDLARGRIRDRQTLARLTVEDIFFLASERLDGKNPLLINGGTDYAIAIEWAEAALE